MGEIEFMDTDNWSGGSNKFGLTFKQIIINHINRCVVNTSVEFHGGRWEKKVVSGQVMETYIRDSREVFCNSIRALRAVLLCYFDDKMKKKDKEIKEAVDTKYKKYVEDLKEEGKYTRALYKEDKVETYFILFEELIKLSKRLNFFEEKSAPQMG